MEEKVSLLKIFKEVKGRPETMALLVILAVFSVTTIAGFFFLPLVLKVVTFLVFFPLVFFLANNSLRLTISKRLLDLKSTEFKSIIENLKDGVIIYDPEFTILSLNRAAEEIFNVKKDELVGQKIEPGFIKNPRFKFIAQVIFPSLAPTVNQISEAGWPQIVDITTDEPALKLRTVLNRMEDKFGGTVGFLKIIRDQTREKNIIQSKSEFITVAAHQLRTPLTAIHWAFETLKQKETDPETKIVVEEGFGLAERSLEIVNDLLDAAKIESGQFGYVFEDLNLTDFAQKAVDRSKPVADSFGIKLYFSPKKEYKIKADPERLSIVFFNLIENAIKYNIKNGSVVVSVDDVPGKPYVKVSVQDSGVGVPEESRVRLFSKFYRAENVTRLEPNGSGLGLYICKNIVLRHGGEISFDSSLGRGTTFWFTLPLDPSLIPPKEIVYEERI